MVLGTVIAKKTDDTEEKRCPCGNKCGDDLCVSCQKKADEDENEYLNRR